MPTPRRYAALALKQSQFCQLISRSVTRDQFGLRKRKYRRQSVVNIKHFVADLFSAPTKQIRSAAQYSATVRNIIRGVNNTSLFQLVAMSSFKKLVVCTSTNDPGIELRQSDIINDSAQRTRSKYVCLCGIDLIRSYLHRAELIDETLDLRLIYIRDNQFGSC